MIGGKNNETRWIWAGGGVKTATKGSYYPDNQVMQEELKEGKRMFWKPLDVNLQG